MKLQKVSIKNFRSIKDATIDFTQDSCRVMVGINESGKSNILKALHLLSFYDDSGKYTPNSEDIRQELPSEVPVKESTIIFRFRLSNQEVQELLEEVSTEFVGQSFKKKNLLGLGGSQLLLNDFLQKHNEGCYIFNLMKSTQQPSSYTIEEPYKVLENWANLQITLDPEHGWVAGNIADTSDEAPCKTPPNEEVFGKVVFDDFYKIYEKHMRAFIKRKIPRCILWSYDDKYLLPDKVNKDALINDDSQYEILRNMFYLAGYENIGECITKASKAGINRYKNRLDGVATKTTIYFNKIWPEYKGVKFELTDLVTDIGIAVKEKNSYDFQQRSDGFKRFISFLLLISMKVEHNLIKDAILLLDEPDLTLHPSSSKAMREEIFNIAKKNRVLYSTHSIHMLDEKNIARHLVVKKDNEITTVKGADVSDYYGKEVLLRALGTSVFDGLEENNLMFEGWHDKKLFNVAINSKKNKDLSREAGDALKKLGLCHLQGVETVENITPIMEMGERRCIIITDSDNAAIKARDGHNQKHGHGEWVTYMDLVNINNKKDITSEDFINNDVIISTIKKMKNDKDDLPEIDNLKLDDNKSNIEALKEWTRGNKDPQRIIKEIKESLFKEIKATDIKDEYYIFLAKLYEKHIAEKEGGDD